jgi:hypothetical protein
MAPSMKYAAQADHANTEERLNMPKTKRGRKARAQSKRGSARRTSAAASQSSRFKGQRGRGSRWGQEERRGKEAEEQWVSAREWEQDRIP